MLGYEEGVSVIRVWNVGGVKVQSVRIRVEGMDQGVKYECIRAILACPTETAESM